MTRINTKGLFLIHYNLKRLCNNQSVPEGPRFLVQISAKFVNKREQEVGRTEAGTLLFNHEQDWTRLQKKGRVPSATGREKSKVIFPDDVHPNYDRKDQGNLELTQAASYLLQIISLREFPIFTLRPLYQIIKIFLSLKGCEIVQNFDKLGQTLRPLFRHIKKPVFTQFYAESNCKNTLMF